MKHFLFLSIIAVACLMRLGGKSSPHRTPQPINAILGDASFTARFGSPPSATTDEYLRIRTHLRHVEALLRKRPVAHLAPSLKAARIKALDRLRQYWQAGIFPRNYDCPEGRVPCFIDRDGRICAVGYLVEQTSGRAVAERINNTHQYEAILAMNDGVVDDWIAGSGLTKREAAMIQPQYGPDYYAQPIPRGYAIGTALLGGTNLALGMVNAAQLQTRPANRGVAIAGLLTSAGQIILGIAKYPEDEAGGFWGGVVPSNNAMRGVSMVNIGVGTATVVLSAWNLFTPLSKDRRTVLHPISFPTENGGAGVGFSVCRKF